VEALDELIAARIELSRLRKRTGNQRRALRLLNKAHDTLWKVVRLQAEGWAKREARVEARQKKEQS
jgi:hypothetical protein